MTNGLSDKHLESNAYLAGETFTLADITAHCGMIGFKTAELPLGEFKNFMRWFDLVSERPSFKRAMTAIFKSLKLKRLRWDSGDGDALVD